MSPTYVPFLPAPSESDQTEHRLLSRLELVMLLHTVGLVIFTTWDFGGETDFARLVISWWGSLALPIAVYACLRRMDHRNGLPSAVRWLWPLLVFDLFVLASTLHPSFVHTFVAGKPAFVHSETTAIWPTTALPNVSLRALWLYNAIYLSCFNLALVVVRRRVLRMLLFVLTVNALLLAVMGTFQKLSHASGLFFGLQPSPNLTFFASFIYHNHWGAFIVLSTAAAVGLLFHYAHGDHRGGRRHSPALFGLVATLFMAASVPLSGTRACTILLLILLTAALFHWLWRLQRRHQEKGERAMTKAAGIAVTVFVLGLSGIYFLSQPVIDARIDKTREQIEAMRLKDNWGNRQQLYTDTWRMAREKLWFGWGLGSYGTVFQMFNQQVSVEGWEPFYAQAHSDWLQSLAEVGMVGTALILLMGLVPLLAVFRHDPLGAVPGYLLTGCGMMVFYAGVEFPFANPAVLEMFWLSFFAAVRYHKLTYSDV